MVLISVIILSLILIALFSFYNSKLFLISLIIVLRLPLYLQLPWFLSTRQMYDMFWFTIMPGRVCFKKIFKNSLLKIGAISEV